MPDLHAELEIFKTFNAKPVKKASEETLVVWTPATSERFILLGFLVAIGKPTVGTTVNLLLKDGTTSFWSQLLIENVFCHIELPSQGYVSKAFNNKLQLTISEEAAFTGTFYGYEE